MSENNTSVLDGIALFVWAILFFLVFVLVSFILIKDVFLSLSKDKTECICAIIFFFFIFLTIIIYCTVVAVKLNRHILRSNKLASLKENYDKSFRCICPCCCADKTLKETTTDDSGTAKTTKEYYPSGKAAVDLYKAYSSAVVDV